MYDSGDPAVMAKSQIDHGLREMIWLRIFQTENFQIEYLESEVCEYSF